MNLGELRLKALQSLKRPFSSTETTDKPVTQRPKATEDITFSSQVTEDTKMVIPKVTDTTTLDFPDKEEGELTDDSGDPISSDSEVENDSNSSNEYHNNQKNYYNRSVKPRNTTWTRNGYRNTSSKKYKYLSDESDSEITEITDKFDLDSLINYKINLLSKIDETQSILAASEDKEHDLIEELQECRNLQKKCERERVLLERKLEKIEKRISFKEKINADIEKEVSKSNFKKNFVGKMMRETYMRSFGDRFRTSSLFRIYSETLKLDPRYFNRIDPMTPFCSVELIDGKCPYYLNGTCSMQHFEEIMKKSFDPS